MHDAPVIARTGTVGGNLERIEVNAKLDGSAKYVDDVVLPDMLHGVTVRSTIPRGRIRSISYLPGVPWDEFTIVTAADIPGSNRASGFAPDQPFLAEGVVNHPEEPILLLAHPDRHVAARARGLVKIDYEPLPAVFTIADSLACTPLVWGKDNVLKRYRVERGEVDAALARPGHVVLEGVYETGAQEQLYLEPNGMLATYDAENGVTVWGSMQCPYFIHGGLKTLFGLPSDKIRVIQTETGGAFGGKEEYPTLIAGHAALLAMKAGKPVKLIYDRAEDMAATTKRHPSRTRIVAAVDATGRLQALDIDFVLDGGAYTTISPVVLSRGLLHAAGAYRCPNTRIVGRAVATNAPPHGAFRGFGAPQSLFALERHLSKLAKAIGLDEVEFRRRNALHDGDTFATGQVRQERVDLCSMLDRAVTVTDYHGKRARFERDNPGSTTKRGIGLAMFLHGAGFTGSGERTLASVVGIEGTAEGRVAVLVSSVEMGQGANTALSQIAADALRISPALVDRPNPDTARVPNSGPTVASRTTMIVGNLVEQAASGLRQTLVQSGLLAEPYGDEEFSAALRTYVQRFGVLRVYTQYRQPPTIHWDDTTYQGDAYGTFAWAVYVAEVAVDLLTYEVRVTDFVALQDVGTLINPMLAEGQVEGGVVQAIGWALSEKVALLEGRMANNRLSGYLAPTSEDVPDVRVVFQETPYGHGPSGAKGLGELPMDGPGPAIANAVSQALGADLDRLPILPEDVLTAVEG